MSLLSLSLSPALFSRGTHTVRESFRRGGGRRKRTGEPTRQSANLHTMHIRAPWTELHSPFISLSLSPSLEGMIALSLG